KRLEERLNGGSRHRCRRFTNGKKQDSARLGNVQRLNGARRDLRRVCVPNGGIVQREERVGGQGRLAEGSDSHAVQDAVSVDDVTMGPSIRDVVAWRQGVSACGHRAPPEWTTGALN